MEWSINSPLFAHADTLLSYPKVSAERAISNPYLKSINNIAMGIYSIFFQIYLIISFYWYAKKLENVFCYMKFCFLLSLLNFIRCKRNIKKYFYINSEWQNYFYRFLTNTIGIVIVILINPNWCNKLHYNTTHNQAIDAQTIKIY